ncbi:retrovirus-related pol polyprotein from transposon TNT 1-94 [Tanacetum coccineum]|uniref:Retrovirus-related pol polyprotein from transposon TNT 1-94 n=1 Tax=Tanacetum coccineum TaxID=301880 RepID=A0ABQ4YXW4_9ASTR
MLNVSTPYRLYEIRRIVGEQIRRLDCKTQYAVLSKRCDTSYLHGYGIWKHRGYAVLGIGQTRFLVKSWRGYAVSLLLDTTYCIKREFSVARTPQQNGVAERKNRTLIEAARTMLTDSKLPTTFWAEAVNTACYVQNRVLVTKPHNKTPYELFLSRKLALCFMRPFGCPVTILNTIDHLGKFDGKVDEGFFVGYSINSKAFKVFNSRTRIVEENLHVQFSENTPNIAGSRPNWLFDIYALTKSMNYKPVAAGNQSNGNVGTKACDDAGNARIETVPGKDYILLPLWTVDIPFSQSSKSSLDAGFKPSGDHEKKVTKEPGKEGGDPSKEDERDDQEKDASVNSTNNVNVASTNEVSTIGRKASIELLDYPNMPTLEDIVYSDDNENVGAETDMNNLDVFMPISPIPTTRMDVNGAFLYDDIIFGSTKKSLCTEFKKMMHKKFHMSSMGELTFFLGLQVTQKEDGVFISQDKYVTEILKKFSFTDVKTPSTPMETQKLLLKDEDGEKVDVHLYRSMIGSLMYLTSSRPDIMFAVCACARYQVNPKVSHLHAVKRIFRYLKGQPKLGLWYPKYSPFDLVAYTDSDYAGVSLDRKSTTGGCQFFGCRLISWQCKKQNVVANSTTEVEYVAASSCCGQFWATVKAKTINEEVQLQALVDGKKVIITESTVRRDLHLEDAEGIDCLPNATIFEQLTLMGYEKVSQKLTFYKAFFSPQWKFLIHTILQCLSAKTTAWNEFSSTMASAIICLATNQKFNFSKYIFESMVKNLENVSGKFLMYPRFVQVFLEKQLEGMSNHKRIYVTPSHTKKIFRNMRRVGKGFSGRETPLFQTMMVQDQEEMGKGLANPTDPHHTPTIIQPSTSQPQKKQKPRKPKRKDTEVPQPSGPTDNVADKAVYEGMDDSLERAATTATSLDAEQDRGNINKTQSKATLNEPSSIGTSSGSGPKRQDTMGDTITQTGFENASKISNDPLLARGNTLQIGEDRLKLEELMEFCTKLHQRVLDLENTKTAQAQEITSLKLRVKKLEKK